LSFRHSVGSCLRKIVGPHVYAHLQASLKPENWFLRKVHGIVHIGANEGQERDLYDSFGLRVLWIEPIPTVFQILARNIGPYPKQRALSYLVTSEDGNAYPFHIANNGGASSSMLDLSKHREMFPHVVSTHTITLIGNKLGTILDREDVDISQYDALVLDTQGAELEVLRGASDILPRFKFVKLEAPDFEAYTHCCQINDLSAFMISHGFSEARRVPFSHKEGVGTYYELIYSRI
jgi:FkbM family methyltransferase